MTSLTRRLSSARTPRRTARFTPTLAGPVLAVLAAVFAVAIPGVALADPSEPAPSGSAARSEAPSAPSPSASADAPSTAASSSAPASSATDPGDRDRTVTVKSPGIVTCEDLDLGVTLFRLNGARMNKVKGNDHVSTVVKDTDVDDDGDPDSLFVTVKDGTTATAVVALHGNRANIYEDTFAPGEYGPFYAPPRPNNAHPPVNHRLVCGQAPSESPSESPSEQPSESPSASVTPSESPSTPPGGLPVTGLAIGGMVLSGLGMVGAGAAMRALRRRNPEAAADGEESTEDDTEDDTDA